MHFTLVPISQSYKITINDNLLASNNKKKFYEMIDERPLNSDQELVGFRDKIIQA